MPPTGSAVEHHSLQVHYQIVKWKNEDQIDFSPTHWGWKNCNGSFELRRSILEPGPAELLNVLRYNCRLSTKTPCGANICSCRKIGLPCVTVCRNCHGNNCTNGKKLNGVIIFTKLFRIVPRILQNIIHCNRLIQKGLTWYTRERTITIMH